MTTKDCFSVLPSVPAAAIRTTAQGNEKHVRSLLFKLAVEMDMMMNILAESMEIPEGRRGTQAGGDEDPL